MDRRQKKTKEAIFNAFIALLSKKHYNKITVGEIIEKADVGRATFYAHFETKDFLLKAMCEELFCHIFDSDEKNEKHKHIFECDAPESAILHLLQHLQKNDNNILELLACENNEVFLRYFKNDLKKLIERQKTLFESKKPQNLPENYWINHLSSSFVETVRWWLENGKKESPRILCDYFMALI